MIEITNRNILNRYKAFEILAAMQQPVTIESGMLATGLSRSPVQTYLKMLNKLGIFIRTTESRVSYYHRTNKLLSFDDCVKFFKWDELSEKVSLNGKMKIAEVHNKNKQIDYKDPFEKTASGMIVRFSAKYFTDKFKTQSKLTRAERKSPKVYIGSTAGLVW